MKSKIWNYNPLNTMHHLIILWWLRIYIASLTLCSDDTSNLLMVCKQRKWNLTTKIRSNTFCDILTILWIPHILIAFLLNYYVQTYIFIFKKPTNINALCVLVCSSILLFLHSSSIFKKKRNLVISKT